MADADLLGFLTVLHRFKAEIEERCPEYFEYQSLRCAIPEDRCFRILPDVEITFADLCEWAGDVYGLSLLPVGAGESLNPLDRVLQERLAAFSHVDGDYAHSTRLACDEQQVKEVLAVLRAAQDQAQAEDRKRVDTIEDRLERLTCHSNGFDLNYLAGGCGTPLVFLNALGQGLRYWHRVLDRLLQDHRVIIWEPRGITCEPYGCGLEEQVLDLCAIVQQEKLDALHLVAWCTGPKVAIDFCLRQPEAIASMVFLNPTFKCFDWPDLPETDYEHNLESLCRVVNKRPAMAASVMTSLKSNSRSKETDLEEMESQALAASVLGRINLDLSNHVLAPFRDETTTLNYVRQLMDFWSHDALANIEQVKTPVLLVSSEYDEVASPEVSISVAPLLSNSQHIRVPGATHYCLYDRPDFIAGLIRSFSTTLDHTHQPSNSR